MVLVATTKKRQAANLLPISFDAWRISCRGEVDFATEVLLLEMNKLGLLTLPAFPSTCLLLFFGASQGKDRIRGGTCVAVISLLLPPNQPNPSHIL